MAAIVGYVTEIEGEFVATAPDGTTRVLQEGDPVYEDESVAGASGNNAMEHVVVTLEGEMADVMLSGEQTQLFDAQLRPVEFSELETQSQPDTLIAMLKEYGEIDAIDTAAGEDIGVVDSSEDVTGEFDEHIDRVVDVEAELRPETTQVYSVENINSPNEDIRIVAADTASNEELQAPASSPSDTQTQTVPETAAPSTARDAAETEPAAYYPEIGAAAALSEAACAAAWAASSAAAAAAPISG